ncbi:hypothetical protein D8B26_000343 [Coccidioides posadasii str. Silveira]|uniref:uncharacterized protein n=1 Tax=Coccidioides posadasii (strain RMSCC 757 / Silveira) TaxID=443226 RepID=UPI001BEFFECF|nr:hypothetical protein D8B26_000343 [Coccidioides posadasii str. Silveira]
MPAGDGCVSGGLFTPERPCVGDETGNYMTRTGLIGRGRRFPSMKQMLLARQGLIPAKPPAELEAGKKKETRGCQDQPRDRTAEPKIVPPKRRRAERRAKGGKKERESDKR